MMNIKVDWLVFCGRGECNSWIQHMENATEETVRINTPTSVDAYLEDTTTSREVLEYTVQDFEQALAILTEKGE